MEFRRERRQFLKKSGLALAGAYLGFFAPRLFKAGPRATLSSNMIYREAGKTGFKISEVGFGGYPVSNPNVVSYALDQGINYIDTSDDYRNGMSEETIGKAIKNKRGQVVLTTKWHPWSYTKVPEMLHGLNTSLRRLQTDHIDFLLVHQIGMASGGESIERLQNQELHKAMEIAKREGKVRFFGCSGHDSDLMEVMNYAIGMPEISMILCRINYKTYPTERDLFKRARERGIAVTVMKTLGGARRENLAAFQGERTTPKQAALKWALSNPDISGLIISISSTQQVDEYVVASGGRA